MSAALVRKELRELRPFAWLGLLFTILTVIDEVALQPRARGLESTFASLVSYDNAFLYFLVSALGTGLAVRGHEEGTLAFLEGLPLTRTRVFLTKLACSLGVLLIYPCLQLTLFTTLHLLARTSLEPAGHLSGGAGRAGAGRAGVRGRAGARPQPPVVAPGARRHRPAAAQREASANLCAEPLRAARAAAPRGALASGARGAGRTAGARGGPRPRGVGRLRPPGRAPRRALVARALAERADEVFAEVHARLHVALGEPIDVDTSGSRLSTVGTAFLGRVRLVLDDEAVLTLAHETAHVVATRLAGGERAHLFAKAALVEALVKRQGPLALKRVLESFADARLPKDLSGLLLWQAVFQLAGVDLGAVLDTLHRDAKADLERLGPQVLRLPRPRAVLVRAPATRPDHVGVRLRLDGDVPQGFEPVVRLRAGDDSPQSTCELAFRGRHGVAGGQEGATRRGVSPGRALAALAVEARGRAL